MSRPIILLKAAKPGGALADLFSVTVPVAGYARRDGAYVAPHTALRLKAVEHATASVPAHEPHPDLFTDPLPDGAPVDILTAGEIKAHPEERSESVV